MGSIMSRVQSNFSYFFSGVKDVKVIMVGLDNAGKTTILYKLHLGEAFSTYPTIGSNVEEVRRQNFRLQVWDLGGQAMLRQTWQMYFVNTNGVILVIDSADPERLDVAREELTNLLNSEELREAAILVFANKQDLKGAVTATEVSEALSLHSIKDREWNIQACSATTGAGLEDGLEWLISRLEQKMK
ncbi:hypothetical protein NDN08_008340 [Rhodosorus marinus]|uniref:ADP-ribosylation factor-like protein 1 n=1 Tax=Rhodosorus marinus TaxID=101924 RepID=A0AAV8V0H7_9RHOD|nr:hypothetical protein NDN08_008340 [Rhodosorus marinus]